MSNIDPSNPEFQAWCRGMYALVKPGGIWAVPRSGLIFRKLPAGGLELEARMPFDAIANAAADGADVPATPEALLSYQDQDFTAIREHFRAVGITVTDRTITPPGDAPHE